MRPAPEKSFFYGSAAAAVCGLALGLALHGPWQSTGGPGVSGILFPSANAAESQPAADDSAVIDTSYTPSDDIYSNNTPLAEEYVPATPQPLIRLNAPKYDAQVAAAEEAKRADADGLMQDDEASPGEPVAYDTASAETGGAAGAASPFSFRLSRADGN